MWLWLCFIDAHASMQNGRAASIDIAEALKVTRTFASMNDAPSMFTFSLRRYDRILTNCCLFAS